MTHEENMKDPVWLAEQMRRYKESLATVQAQHDALHEQVQALRVQLGASVERTAELESICSKLKHELDAHVRRTVDLVSENEQVAAERNAERKRASEALALAQQRRTALATVWELNAAVAKQIMPLLES